MPETMYEGELAKNNKLTDYGKKVVEEHLWTVEYTIGKFFPRTSAEREELCSIANEALVRAAIKFDLEKSIKFSTFAVICIKSALCIFFKYFNQDQKFIKKNNNYLDAKEQKKIEEIRLSRKEQGYREIEIQDELARIIETILNSLKGNRRRIFLYLIGGITQKEVSDKLGITHQRVSQIKMAAMKELKLAMSDIEDNTEKIFSFKIKYCKFKLGILIKSQYLQEEVIKLFSNKFHTEQRKNKIIIEGALEDKTFLFLADIMLNLENIL